MTTTTVDRHPSPFGRFFSRIGNGMLLAFEIMAEASNGMRCAREAERLFELSDVELAKRGLTRDRIIQHAFAGWI